MSQGKTRDIDRIMVERGRRGDFSPRQSDHYHNYYEIFFLLSGNCRFLLNDSVYPLEKGDFVLIAPGSLHHALYDTAACEILTIYFKKEYIDRNLLTPNASEVFRSFMGSIPALYQDAISSLLGRMLSEGTQIDEFSDRFMPTTVFQEGKNCQINGGFWCTKVESISGKLPLSAALGATMLNLPIMLRHVFGQFSQIQ